MLSNPTKIERNRLAQYAPDLSGEPIHHQPYEVISPTGEISLIDPLKDERSSFTSDMFSIKNLVENGVDLQLMGTINSTPIASAASAVDIINTIDNYVNSNSKIQNVSQDESK